MDDVLSRGLRVRVDKLGDGDAPIYDGGDRAAIVAGALGPELMDADKRYVVPLAGLTADRLRVIADAMDLDVGRHTGIIVVRASGWHGSEIGYLSV